MTKTWVVAVREFHEVVRTKAFLIGSILMPLMILGFVFGAERIASFADQEEQPPRVAPAQSQERYREPREDQCADEVTQGTEGLVETGERVDLHRRGLYGARRNSLRAAASLVQR